MTDRSTDNWRKTRMTRMRPYAKWPESFDVRRLFSGGLFILFVDAASDTQGTTGIGLESVLLTGLCFWLACTFFRAEKAVPLYRNDERLRQRSLFFGERRYQCSDLTAVRLPASRWRRQISREAKNPTLRFGPRVMKISTKGGFIDPRDFAAIKDVAQQTPETYARAS